MSNTSKPLMAVDIESANLSAKHDINCPVWSVAVYSDSRREAVQFDDDAVASLNYLQRHHRFVFHNASFDVPALRLRGVNVENDYLDTMCMSYTLYPENHSEHSLAVLAELVGLEKLGKPQFDAFSEDMLVYNLRDAEITFRLAEYFLPLLQEDEQLWDYFNEIELPYIERIIEMESNGVYIDKRQLVSLEAKYNLLAEVQLNSLRSTVGSSPGKVHEYTQQEFSHYQQVKLPNGKVAKKPYYVTHRQGTFSYCELKQFNPGSTQQVAEALVKVYPHFAPKKKTPTGAPRLDKDTLAELSVKYPLCNDIQEYNKSSDFVSKFLSPLNALLAYKEYVYANFNQFQTRTRRLSSSQPNLQNIPARDSRGAELRALFTAPEGYKVLCGDLDRIEVVVLGWYLEILFGSTKLSDAIRAKEEVHSINASNWGVERKNAKNGLFCVVYGGGRNRLAQTLKVPVSQAAKILKAMENDLPELFEYRDLVAAECTKNGGILYDWFGGRFVIPELLSPRPEIVQMGRRQVGNYVIQGTAGTIFKILQLRAAEEMMNNGLDCRLVMAVHDEAVYYARENEAEFAANVLTDVFSPVDLLQYGDITLPINAKFHASTDWYSAKGD